MIHSYRSHQGADRSAISAYNKMRQDPSIQTPRSWSSPDFYQEPYNLHFFPGGHDKGVRQVIDSPIVHQHLATYFPQTLRSTSTPSKPPTKTIAAVCHGVMVLSSTSYSSGTHKGKSVLHDAITTALPTLFERAAFWGTRAFLGDYYKTYGAGSENVQQSVTKVLASPDQFKCYNGFAPFVVEDPTYWYLSARWPGDAEMLATRAVEMVRGG